MTRAKTIAVAFTIAALPAVAAHAGSGDDMTAQTIAGDAERGATHYESACAECHATPSRIMRRVRGDDAEARAAALETFLADHYAPDAQTRADIIAYLVNL